MTNQPAKPWTRRAASARAISSSLGSVVRPSVTKNFVLAQHYPSPVADAVRFAFHGRIMHHSRAAATPADCAWHAPRRIGEQPLNYW
jgi:hypothetical protein